MISKPNLYMCFLKRLDTTPGATVSMGILHTFSKVSQPHPLSTDISLGL